jgi:putative transposase
MRKTNLINNGHYHIYNRGVDKRNIFQDQEDIERFFQSIQEFNTIEPIGSIHENKFKKNKKLGRPTSKLVKFVSYCLNHNHYHFILKQTHDNGISEFMKRLGGYTKYFNKKYKRSGVLFQGKFKSSYINIDQKLLELSVYVNLNWKIHSLGRPTSKLIKSSWEEYIEDGFSRELEFCEKDIILENFENKKEYKKFAEKNLKRIIEERKIKKGKYCLE